MKLTYSEEGGGRREEAWGWPLLTISPRIVRRLVSSPARQNEAGGSSGGATQHAATFAVRVGTMDGVVTHHLRAETRRDLAAWARAIVQGCHAAAHSLREYTVREYIRQQNSSLRPRIFEIETSLSLKQAFPVKQLFYRKILDANFSVDLWKEPRRLYCQAIQDTVD